jgi:hypothetical protein
MIRTIGKILVILLVTALVAGVLYAVVQSGNVSGAADRPRLEGSTGNNLPTRPEGFREHDGETEASLGRGLGGLLVSLLQIGAITFIVLQIQKALAKSIRQKSPELT